MFFVVLVKWIFAQETIWGRKVKNLKPKQIFLKNRNFSYNEMLYM